MTTQIPTGAQLYDLWIQYESNKESDPLTELAAAPYLAIWTAWLKHLASIQLIVSDGEDVASLEWQDAKAEQVIQFLRPRRGQKAAHNPGRGLSEVTRRRYWRVLDRLYRFAAIRGWVALNPVEDLPDNSTPKVSPQLGHTLPDQVWLALPNYFPDGDTMYDVRDRAILFLLYELALAPEEIRNMRPSDITFDQGPASNGSVATSVRVLGKREYQQRVLRLPAMCSSSLRTWLDWRSGHEKSNKSEWLFVSNRGSQLAVSVLFSVVADSVIKAGKSHDRQEGQGLPKRVGPQVIRNTAIVHFLRNGMSLQEVVRFIGIKNDKGLRRLSAALRS